MANPWTAGPGELASDRDRQDDGPRDPVCAECGQLHHAPDCPYVQHVTEKIRREQPATQKRSAA